MSESSSVINKAAEPPMQAGPLDAAPSPDSQTEQTAPSDLASASDGLRTVDPVEKTVISKSPIEPPTAFAHAQSVADLAKVLIGQELDHYILDALIGGGGMGAVFRGHDKLLDRTVAVKVIPAARRDADTLRRFRIEAQSAAKLDNPNIARVYNFGESENWNYIVFEFVEGTNLRDLVTSQGPLTVDDAVYYVRQVAEALAHASSRNIVHRDIKPSNVLVTPSGDIKVVDMGLARMTALETSHDITASGVTLGTFDYVSPEQAKDPRDADVRSDLYSLGCTFYFLLTARPPFPEGTAVQKLFKHTSEMPDDPRHYRDDLSPELVAILFKLIAKKPTDRYQSAQELVSDLQLLAEIEQLPRSRTLIGTAPVVARLSRKTSLESNLPWIASVALLVCVALGLYWMQDWNDDFVLPPIVAASSRTSAMPDNQSRPDDQPSPSQVSPSPSEAGNLNESPVATPSVSESSTGASLSISSGQASEDNRNAETRSDVKDSVDNGGAGNQRKPPATPATNSAKLVEKTIYVVPSLAEPRMESKPQFTALEDAIQFANANKQVEQIQILAEQISPAPFALIQRSISIVAGDGIRPKIVFGESSDDSLDASSAMDLVDCNVDFVGLHFVYRASNSSQPEALIRSSENTRLTLVDCTITLIGDDDRRTSTAFETNNNVPAMVEVIAAKRDSGEDSSGDAGLFQLKLENFIVRGDGDFVRMPDTVRSEVIGRNGLICLAGSVFRLTGNEARHRSLSTVRVSLDRVTSISIGSFAKIEMSESNPFKVALVRQAMNSAFWCPKEVAFIAIEGLEDASDARRMISLRGSDNAYDQNISAAIQSSTLSGQTTSLDFGELGTSDTSESGIETSIRWLQNIPAVMTFSNQTPIQFRQRPGEFLPGFDERRLPSLPD